MSLIFKSLLSSYFPPRSLYTFIFTDGLNLPVFFVPMSGQFVLKLPPPPHLLELKLDFRHLQLQMLINVQAFPEKGGKC